MTNMAVSRRCEWQNKIIRIFFSFFIAIGAILHIAPFSIVKAETSIYMYNDSGTGQYTGFAFNYYGTYYYQYYSNYQNPHIYVTLVFSDSNYSNAHVVVFSDNSSSFQWGGFTGSWASGGSVNTSSLQLDSDTGLYYYVGSGTDTYVNTNNSSNYVINENVNSLSGIDLFHYVLGIEDPYNVLNNIDYGNIKDLSYSTNIVGSGTANGDANIDTISWYPYWDKEGNISTNWNMEIQVVPGTWQGGTSTDIFSQSYQDFIINESGALDIYRGTYLNGSFSISWGEVKNKLSILSWADLFQYFDGTYWNKKGWVYRARYNDPDNDYWSEWQTVYTVTSSTGEGVEKIIDPSTGTGLGDFNNNVENSYNTTSVVNNNYNVTYYYNGIPVNTNINDDEITDYSEKIYELTKQIRDILVNLNTNNSTTENNDNDETITNNLNSVVDDLHNTENQFMTDMDEKLNDIDRNVELLNDNKFIAAANWVRVQYDNIVSDTPFELLIVFGLVLSLALIIIGKIR